MPREFASKCQECLSKACVAGRGKRCKWHCMACPTVGCWAHAFPPLPVLWLDEIMR